MNPVRTKTFYYAYVIQSNKDGRFYTGFTVDLRKRLKEHNESKYISWTKGRGPFDLIYYEACKNKEDARQREKYLKTGRGKRFIKERLRRFLVRTG
ncbi:MAG: GIY-YIG nuclease family protein [Candidatus Yanofskybacteria bacterium]|nr:GIY-YIG nuclease family protein [Candidatus Yanofskybacteria bacterium]